MTDDKKSEGEKEGKSEGRENGGRENFSGSDGDSFEQLAQLSRRRCLPPIAPSPDVCVCVCVCVTHSGESCVTHHWVPVCVCVLSGLRERERGGTERGRTRGENGRK